MPALQIRQVPPQIHRALADEADRRGQSLQTYLLDVLEREAAASTNRRLLVDWSQAPLVAAIEVDVVHHLHAGREERDAEIARSLAGE